MSHPDRGKLKQRKKEEMLKMKNYFDKPDPTPFYAVENIINRIIEKDTTIEFLKG